MTRPGHTGTIVAPGVHDPVADGAANQLAVRRVLDKQRLQPCF